MKLTGFTPVLDEITDRYGLYSSAIFGRILRYQNGDNKVCSASQTTLAKDLGISRSTLIRHLQPLIEAGLVVEQGASEHGTILYTTRYDLVLELKGLCQSDTGGVSERHTNKQYNKQILNCDTFVSQEWVELLSQVTGMDYKVNGGRLARLGKVLHKAGYTLGDIQKCYAPPDGLWYKHDWRGRKGSKPTHSMINATIQNLMGIVEKTYKQELQEAGYV